MSKIDINKADVATLAQLDGIGAKLAARIVTYRETVHPFTEIMELAAVPGISEQMVYALEDEIVVAPVPPLEDEMRTVGEEIDDTVAEVASVPQEVPESTTPRHRRRSCLGYLLASLFGAFLGAGLTLLLLYALNGTLAFASPLQVARLQSQVVEQSEGQSGLTEEVTALSARLGTVTAADATTSAALTDSATALATMEGELAALETELADDLSTLERETDTLATRVDGLSAAAEDFDLFLDGLRELLIQLRGLPPLPAMTATPALTTTATVTLPSPAGTPTATPVVTRTPRPTATPLAPPTPINIP